MASDVFYTEELFLKADPPRSSDDSKLGGGRQIARSDEARCLSRFAYGYAEMVVVNASILTTVDGRADFRRVQGIDANGQSLAYVYSRDTDSDALIANVLTTDEARRIASAIAKLPKLLGKGD